MDIHAYVQSGPVYVVAVLVSIEIGRPQKSAARNYLWTVQMAIPGGVALLPGKPNRLGGVAVVDKEWVQSE